MSQYLQTFARRITNARRDIGRAQADIMAGRNIKAARELIAKAEATIAKNQRLIAVNTPKG